MITNGKKIKISGINKTVHESLNDVSTTYFEQVYRQTDTILAKLIKDDLEDARGNEDNEQCVNTIAFLGERGRGKTSAMLSFCDHLNKLKESKWSHIPQNINFLSLPYIDAAMLAEAEYIIDVILAEMWDKFEEYVSRSFDSHDAKFERLERDIKLQFISVRKAYLILKDKEEGKSVSKELDMPVPGALYELAASINLRQELQRLIKNYLEIFQYNKCNKGCYLVIAIDDVDMSGGKAHFILEQIRRYLCMRKVIILVTADIERLQLACEARYMNIYEGNDRRKFINEYLEKVLPYNMRIYLPEIEEETGKVPIEIPNVAEFEFLNAGKGSIDEKDSILKFIAKKCNIFFDNYRRRRHFLQNRSLRSLANYFSHMANMQDDCISWLKSDLKERIAERIQSDEQKKCIYNLLAMDYEDMNGYLISYITQELMLNVGVDVDINININDKSLGQVLYACKLYEEQDSANNMAFVNAVIMYYSIILQQHDTDVKSIIVGDSLWGEQEYGMATSVSRNNDWCTGFDENGSLKLALTEELKNKLFSSKVDKIFQEIININKDNIIVWLCVMLFVTPDNNDYIDSNKFSVELEPETAVSNVEETEKDENKKALAKETEGTGEKKNIAPWIILKPKFMAKKNFITNAFRKHKKTRERYHNMLVEAFNSFAYWLYDSSEDNEKNVETLKETKKISKDMADEIIKEIFDNKCNSKDKNNKKGSNRVSDDAGEFGSITNAIEILYSLVMFPKYIPQDDIFEEKRVYKKLILIYGFIQNKLKALDDYYKEFNTDFLNEFEDSIQAKALLGELGVLQGNLKEEFENQLGKVMMDYYSNSKPITILQKNLIRNNKD